MSSTNNTKSTRINNAQRQAYAKIIEQQSRPMEYYSDDFEKLEAKEIEKITSKHQAKISSYNSFLAKVVALKEELRKFDFEFDYSDWDMKKISLSSEASDALLERVNKVKVFSREQALQDVWASQTLEEAKAVMSKFLGQSFK